MRYLVVVEKGSSSYGAHVPDLPGCIAAGETKEEVLLLIREAIEFHLDDLKQGGNQCLLLLQRANLSKYKLHNLRLHSTRGDGARG
jgi:predicted RNase H-like HicB family nuclease